MCEKSTKYARGTVWWVNTIDDSMCSTSQKGRRPFLIISNDEFNIRFGKVTVIPMSSQSKYDKYDYSVPTAIDDKVVYALVDQIRQIDTFYLLHYAYTINENVLHHIDNIITNLYTDLKITYNTNNNDINVELNSTISILNSCLDKFNSFLFDFHKYINTITNNKDKSNIHSESLKNVNTNVISDKTNTKKVKKNKSSMPYKFYSDLTNNIEFWNDLLINGETYVCNKYNLKNRAAFNRRKSRVKLYLIKCGYDISNIIE
jgi:mRNA-degrading endonuclease toxin of MazEF toxin-antitoxin module